MPKVTFHKKSLIKRMGFDGWYAPMLGLDPAWDTDNVSGRVATEVVCNDTGKTLVVSGSFATSIRDGMTPAEILAMGAVSHYIHECGEHVFVEGLELNQHTAEGVRNTARVVGKIHEWLTRIVANMDKP